MAWAWRLPRADPAALARVWDRACGIYRSPFSIGSLTVPEGGTVLQTLLSTSALMRRMPVRDRNAGA